MFISGLAPMFAEPVRNKFLSMFNSKQQPNNFEEFTKQIEPLTKDLQPELKSQIFTFANDFYGEKKGDVATKSENPL